MNKVSIFKQTGLFWIWISLVIVIIDQGTKWFILKTFTVGETTPITSFLSLVLAENRGAAYSFLDTLGNFALILFAGIAFVVSIILCIWMRRLPRSKYWLNISLALILGGAVGNLIDRFFHGYVIDFVLFRLPQSRLAIFNFIFNFADAAITVGAIMLVIDLLFMEKKHENFTG